MSMEQVPPNIPPPWQRIPNTYMKSSFLRPGPAHNQSRPQRLATLCAHEPMHMPHKSWVQQRKPNCVRSFVRFRV